MTILHLDKNNRMLRAGFGKNDGNWFIRVDLWWFGLRLSGKKRIMGNQVVELSTGHVFVPDSIKSIGPLKRSAASDKGVPTFAVYGVGFRVDILLEGHEEGFWWYPATTADKPFAVINFSPKCHDVHKEFVTKLLKN